MQIKRLGLGLVAAVTLGTVGVVSLPTNATVAAKKTVKVASKRHYANLKANFKYQAKAQKVAVTGKQVPKAAKKVVLFYGKKHLATVKVTKRHQFKLTAKFQDFRHLYRVYGVNATGKRVTKVVKKSGLKLKPVSFAGDVINNQAM